MEPDELIVRAKAAGLDGVCITEHDQLWDVEAIERLGKKHDFLVIGGVEVSTDYGHVLAFGLHASIRDVYYIEDLHDLATQAGGVLVAAHPFRYEPELVAEFARAQDGFKPLEAVCKWPVFQLVKALEIYNGRSGFREKELTTLVADRLHLKGTGGSDAHAGLEVGSCYSVFENEIRGEADLVAEIKQGNCHGVDPRWGASL
jgi:predicted metal-dependent phosphoesterase TrpH